VILPAVHPQRAHCCKGRKRWYSPITHQRGKYFAFPYLAFNCNTGLFHLNHVIILLADGTLASKPHCSHSRYNPSGWLGSLHGGSRMPNRLGIHNYKPARKIRAGRRQFFSLPQVIIFSCCLFLLKWTTGPGPAEPSNPPAPAS
jgi:hypothetical protein